MGNTKPKRGILSPQQSQQLIDSIRKIQIGNDGLTKKAVVERAFTETFGNNIADWPIQPHSSTVNRYWKYAFPSEKAVSLEKRKPYRSAQPLIEDLRRTPIETTQHAGGYKQIVCICPECNTLIKIQTTKLS